MKLKRLLIPVTAATLLLAACGQSDEEKAQETVEQMQPDTDTSSQGNGPSEDADDTTQEENSDTEQSDEASADMSTIEVQINPDNYDQTGSEDAESATNVAMNLASNDVQISEFRLFERLIQPGADDTHDAYHPVTAQQAVNVIDPMQWEQNAYQYALEHTPESGEDYYDDAYDVLVDPDGGAFSKDAANAGVQTLYSGF